MYRNPKENLGASSLLEGFHLPLARTTLEVLLAALAAPARGTGTGTSQRTDLAQVGKQLQDQQLARAAR